MKKGPIIGIIIILIIVGLIAWWAYESNLGYQAGSNSTSTSATVTSTNATGTSFFDKSISDGAITLSYPSSDFGAASNQQEITAKSYIPPCDPTFDYCLFYIGTSYQGTNFDSAGIRIQKRTDLVTQMQCLNNEPTGYNSLTPSITTYSDYAISEFGSQANPIGNAGAGHFADDIVYRVATNGSCYEFETRVSQSQFANYPTGAIQQFTTADQAALQSELMQILSTLSLASGTTIIFPQH